MGLNLKPMKVELFSYPVRVSERLSYHFEQNKPINTTVLRLGCLENIAQASIGKQIVF